MGTINNMNIYSGTTVLNGDVVRNALNCYVPVTCGSFNHTLGVAGVDVFNGILNLNFSGSGGGVTLLGTSGSSTVYAKGSYSNLQIKRANGIMLTGNINITSSLKTTGGGISLNGSDVNLLPGSTLTETPGNLIWTPTTGAVKTYSYFGYAPTNENVCNIGIKLSMDADPGYTTITRYPVITNANSQVSISRKFEIVTTNAVNITNTRVYYDDLELNGNNENSASFDVKTSTNGGTS